MKWNKDEFLKKFTFLLSAYGGDLQALQRGDLSQEERRLAVKNGHLALARAVMAETADTWEKSKRAFPRRVGYFSAEFLIGRAVFSNLLNLGLLQTTTDAFAKIGVDINAFEEIEDAALGNGGLGRLAACFLESAATKKIPLDGYGLRYRYGLFKQSFENGFQKESADDWLAFGDGWSVRREEERVRVDFADYSVYAVPYDTPVFGYKSDVINTLRLWQSEPLYAFDFSRFDSMRGEEQARENFKATQITAVLYPNDNTEEGKILRLRQQYLMVSASLQSILAEMEREGKDVRDIPKCHTFQLNDTHPTLAIPELIRLLQKKGVAFAESVRICQKTFCFTNHTIMGEALERWGGTTFRKILPELWEILLQLQAHAEREGLKKGENFIVKDDVAYMANLAIYASGKVNGVARLHTEILKADTFSSWYKIMGEKFVNVTNGITPRRWLLLCNPALAKAITARISAGWETELSRLIQLRPYVQDKEFRAEFTRIKQENKRRLAEYIARKEGVELNPDFIFDVQVKRLHEYKRQLLNALSIVYIYYGLKSGEIKDFKPTAFIFGAKAAPGYKAAKAIIKFINEIAKKVNADSQTRDKLRVVFVQNYNVSYAEKIVCAADISEQISLAGMEASGTGNMKFMLNGTVTLGTLDGANVEICEEAGQENNYIFGATVKEVYEVKRRYNPRDVLEKNPKLKRAVESLIDGTFPDTGGALKGIYEGLVCGENADRYLVLYDFEDYIRTKLRLNRDYGTEPFTTKCLENMINAGKFSSDRSICEYAEKIWHV